MKRVLLAFVAATMFMFSTPSFGTDWPEGSAPPEDCCVDLSGFHVQASHDGEGAVGYSWHLPTGLTFTLRASTASGDTYAVHLDDMGCMFDGMMCSQDQVTMAAEMLRGESVTGGTAAIGYSRSYDGFALTLSALGKYVRRRRIHAGRRTPADPRPVGWLPGVEPRP